MTLHEVVAAFDVARLPDDTMQEIWEMFVDMVNKCLCTVDDSDVDWVKSQ